jgi:hypothetical protein
MPALTKERNTPVRTGQRRSDPVAAATTIYAGALVVLNAAGNAVPGSTATGLKARGVAQATVDNSAGGAGDLRVESERGVFRFGNSAGADEITRTHIGATAYIVDDQTVAATDGTATRSAAGTIIDVDDQGVWVEIA